MSDKTGMMIVGFLDLSYVKTSRVFSEKGVCPCLNARDYKDAVKIMTEEPKRMGNLYGEGRGTGFAGNVWDKDHISPTITTSQGGKENL